MSTKLKFCLAPTDPSRSNGAIITQWRVVVNTLESGRYKPSLCQCLNQNKTFLKHERLRVRSLYIYS